MKYFPLRTIDEYPGRNYCHWNNCMLTLISHWYWLQHIPNSVSKYLTVISCVVTRSHDGWFIDTWPNIKPASSVLIYSYIMQHEWKLGKLEIVWKPFRVFPISTSVDITIYIYQYGKMFYIFSYNIAQRNMKKEIFRARQRSEFTNAIL